MTVKALKISAEVDIDFEEVLVPAPEDVPVIPDEKYGYLHAPDQLINACLSVASASSSSNAFGRSPYYAMDGARGGGQFWSSVDGFPQWIEVDLGRVWRILNWFIGGMHWVENAPVSSATSAFKIQYRNNPTAEWTDAVAFNDDVAPSDPLSGVFPAPIEARYWRVYITKAGTAPYAEIGEFQLNGYLPVPLATQTGDLGGTQTATKVTGLMGYPIAGEPISGTSPIFNGIDGQFEFGAGGEEGSGADAALNKAATASSTYSDRNGTNWPGNAFDGTESSEWSSGTGSSGAPHWLQVDLGAPVSINKYRVHGYSDSSSADAIMRDFQLQWLDPDGTTWHVADKVEGNATDNVFVRSISATTARIWRLYITQATQLGSDGYARISSFNLYQRVAPTAPTRIAGMVVDPVPPDATHTAFTWDPETGKIVWSVPGSGGGSGGGTTIESGTTFPTTPGEGDLFVRIDETPYALYLRHNSAWHKIGDGVGTGGGTGGSGTGSFTFDTAELTPPVLADFSWVNQNTAVTDTVGGGFTLTKPANGGISPAWLVKAAPTAPYSLQVFVKPHLMPSNFVKSGIGWRDSSTGRFVTFTFIWDNGGAMGMGKYLSPTGWNDWVWKSSSAYNFSTQGVWLRLRDDGTNIFQDVSEDGLHWFNIFSISRTFYTPNLDQLAVFVDPENGSYDSSIKILSWKEAAIDYIAPVASGGGSGGTGGSFSGSATSILSIPIDTTAPDATNNTFKFDSTTNKIKWLPELADLSPSPAGTYNWGSVNAQGQVLDAHDVAVSSGGGTSGDAVSIRSIPVDATPPDATHNTFKYDPATNSIRWATDLVGGGSGGSASAGFLGASVHASGNVNVPVTTVTVFSFDTEDYDAGNFFDPAQPTRLTVPAGKTGYYRVTGGVRFNPGGGQRRECFIRLNGTTALVEAETVAGGSTYTAMNPTKTVYLQAGDYVEFGCYVEDNLSTYQIPPIFFQIEAVGSGSGAGGAGETSGDDVAQGKTATATTSYNNSPPSNAFDGNDSTQWATSDQNRAYPQILRVDLGAPFTINKWRLKGYSDGSDIWAVLRQFEIQYSTDDTTWYTADRIDDNVPGNNIFVRNITDTTARYWRVYVTAATINADNIARISSFNLYEAANIPAATRIGTVVVDSALPTAANNRPFFDAATDRIRWLPAGGGTGRDLALLKPATASSTYGGTSPDYAVDGDEGRVWSSGSGWGGAPHWLQVDLGAAYTVGRWRVNCFVQVDGPGVIARSFKIQYLDTDGTTWRDADSISGNSAESDISRDISGIRARYWRLYLTEATQLDRDGYARIASFNLYELVGGDNATRLNGYKVDPTAPDSTNKYFQFDPATRNLKFGPLATRTSFNSGTSFPTGAGVLDGDLFVRTDFTPWRLYQYATSDTTWHLLGDGTGGGGGGGGSATYDEPVATPPASPAEGDLWLPKDGTTIGRYDGTSWGRYGPIFKFKPVVPGDFSWLNQGSATMTTDAGVTVLTQPPVGTVNYSARVKNAPAASNWTVDTYIAAHLQIGSGNACGPIWYDSTSGKAAGLLLTGTNGNGIVHISWWLLTSSFGIVGVYNDEQMFQYAGISDGHWFRMGDDGTYRYCSISNDGQHWTRLWQVGRTTDFTADKVGFMINSQTNGDSSVSVYHWDEKVY